MLSKHSTETLDAGLFRTGIRLPTGSDFADQRKFFQKAVCNSGIDQRGTLAVMERCEQYFQAISSAQTASLCMLIAVSPGLSFPALIPEKV